MTSRQDSQDSGIKAEPDNWNALEGSNAARTEHSLASLKKEENQQSNDESLLEETNLEEDESFSDPSDDEFILEVGTEDEKPKCETESISSSLLSSPPLSPLSHTMSSSPVPKSDIDGPLFEQEAPGEELSDSDFNDISDSNSSYKGDEVDDDPDCLETHRPIPHGHNECSSCGLPSELPNKDHKSDCGLKLDTCSSCANDESYKLYTPYERRLHLLQVHDHEVKDFNGPWGLDEENDLVIAKMRNDFSYGGWGKTAKRFPGRSSVQCRSRYSMIKRSRAVLKFDLKPDFKDHRPTRLLYEGLFYCFHAENANIAMLWKELLPDLDIDIRVFDKHTRVTQQEYVAFLYQCLEHAIKQQDHTLSTLKDESMNATKNIKDEDKIFIHLIFNLATAEQNFRFSPGLSAPSSADSEFQIHRSTNSQLYDILKARLKCVGTKKGMDKKQANSFEDAFNSWFQQWNKNGNKDTSGTLPAITKSSNLEKNMIKLQVEVSEVENVYSLLFNTLTSEAILDIAYGWIQGLRCNKRITPEWWRQDLPFKFDRSCTSEELCLALARIVKLTTEKQIEVESQPVTLQELEHASLVIAQQHTETSVKEYEWLTSIRCIFLLAQVMADCEDFDPMIEISVPALSKQDSSARRKYNMALYRLLLLNKRQIIPQDDNHALPGEGAVGKAHLDSRDRTDIVNMKKHKIDSGTIAMALNKSVEEIDAYYDSFVLRSATKVTSPSDQLGGREFYSVCFPQDLFGLREISGLAYKALLRLFKIDAPRWNNEKAPEFWDTSVVDFKAPHKFRAKECRDFILLALDRFIDANQVELIESYIQDNVKSAHSDIIPSFFKDAKNQAKLKYEEALTEGHSKIISASRGSKRSLKQSDYDLLASVSKRARHDTTGTKEKRASITNSKKTIDEIWKPCYDFFGGLADFGPYQRRAGRLIAQIEQGRNLNTLDAVANFLVDFGIDLKEMSRELEENEVEDEF